MTWHRLTKHSMSAKQERLTVNLRGHYSCPFGKRLQAFHPLDSHINSLAPMHASVVCICPAQSADILQRFTVDQGIGHISCLQRQLLQFDG